MTLKQINEGFTFDFGTRIGEIGASIFNKSENDPMKVYRIENPEKIKKDLLNVVLGCINFYNDIDRV